MIDYQSLSKEEAFEFINRIEQSDNIDLTQLAIRATNLIQSPKTFSYELWCLGGYVNDD